MSGGPDGRAKLVDLSPPSTHMSHVCFCNNLKKIKYSFTFTVQAKIHRKLQKAWLKEIAI